MWTLGDDDVGTKLTSGLTRVKKDRDYCVKLDLIPLASNLTLTGTGCNAIINRKQELSQKNRSVTMNQILDLFVFQPKNIQFARRGRRNINCSGT